MPRAEIPDGSEDQDPGWTPAIAREALTDAIRIHSFLSVQAAVSSQPVPVRGLRLDTLQEIPLAEGVGIHLRPASPLVRALAYVIDLLIFILINIVMGIVISILGILDRHMAGGIMLILSFLLMWFYNVFFETGKKGATPGQRMMGLRVVSETGGPVTIAQSFVRNVLRVVDFMPVCYGLGIFVALGSKRFQRLGDIAARALVVHDDAARRGAWGRRQALAPPLPVAARALPAPVRPEESRAITDFAARLSTWSPARQEELAVHAGGLTGTCPPREGVERLLGYAAWLSGQDKAGMPPAPPVTLPANRRPEGRIRLPVR